MDGADNPRATLVELLLAMSVARTDEFGEFVRNHFDDACWMRVGCDNEEIVLPCHFSSSDASSLGEESRRLGLDSVGLESSIFEGADAQFQKDDRLGAQAARDAHAAELPSADFMTQYGGSPETYMHAARAATRSASGRRAQHA